MYMRYHSLNQYKSMNAILDEDQASNQGALWLGDYTAANDLNLLKNKNVLTVLTVASGLNIAYPARQGITHKTYNILDIESANIKRIFAETYAFITEGLQRGSVLVHCAAGVSRSASTVIAFLMKRNNWGFTEAYNFVRKKRAVICPNFGFQRQLKQYERELQGASKQTQQAQTDVPLTKKSLDVLTRTYTPKKTVAEKQSQSNIFSGQKQQQQVQKISPISRYAPKRKVDLIQSQMLGNKIFINHNLIQKTFQK